MHAELKPRHFLLPHEAEMYYVTSSTRIDALRNHLGVSQAKRFNSIQQNAFAVNSDCSRKKRNKIDLNICGCSSFLDFGLEDDYAETRT